MFRKLNLDKVFKAVSSQTLRGILEKYKLDFLLCGYQETLSDMYKLVEQKLGDEES